MFSFEGVKYRNSRARKAPLMLNLYGVERVRAFSFKAVEYNVLRTQNELP